MAWTRDTGYLFLQKRILSKGGQSGVLTPTCHVSTKRPRHEDGHKFQTKLGNIESSRPVGSNLKREVEGRPGHIGGSVGLSLTLIVVWHHRCLSVHVQTHQIVLIKICAVLHVLITLQENISGNSLLYKVFKSTTQPGMAPHTSNPSTHKFNVSLSSRCHPKKERKKKAAYKQQTHRRKMREMTFPSHGLGKRNT